MVNSCALTVCVASDVTPGVVLGAKQQAIVLLTNPADSSSHKTWVSERQRSR
jgi:hypothetical protein